MRSTAPYHPTGLRLAPWIETWHDGVFVLERTLGPLLDLAVRLWLAQIFFVSGMLKTQTWVTTVLLYTSEHPVPGLDPNTAALLGTGIELVCPVLLAFGLGTRFAAVPLLLTAAFLQFTYKELTDHLYWMALFGFLIVRGPGPISLDHLIAPHLASAAVPGGALLRRIAGVLDRFVLPPYAALVRTGLALLIWIAGFAHTPQPLKSLGAGLCVLLAIGLATRPVALLIAVLALAGFSPWGLALGDPVLCVFLLLTYLSHGAGFLSVDGVLTRGIRRLCPGLSGDRQWLAEAPRVVIVGAGFGGIAAAQALRHAWARVTVIDRRNYHLFQPLLYQVATATLSPADIAVPIRALLRDQPNCQVLMGRVDGIDTEKREVVAGERRVPYDYLVLATGARHSYFGQDDWEPFAPGLKKIDDATAMRRRILAAFERAEASEDADERRRLLTFVIVGGGPTGVELAGAIAELARQTLREEFRTVDPAARRVVLVQSAPRILPALPESLSAAATRSLQELGVEVRTERPRRRASTMAACRSATSASRRAPCCGPPASWPRRPDAGSAPSATAPAASSSRPISPCPALPGVFAIGDTAACDGPGGKPLPGLAAVAKQQGHYVAKVIRAAIEGRRRARAVPLPRLRLDGDDRPQGGGRRSARHQAQRQPRPGGCGASCTSAFLVDLRSRVAVLFDWFWSYLTYNRSMRLITGGEGGGE